MNIQSFINSERIISLHSSSRDLVLAELVGASSRCLKSSSDSFLKALIQREELMSTGFGFGVAYPHARSIEASSFFITVGHSKKGIEWDAFDENPVHLFFLIGGPEGQQEQYLRLLATVSTFLKNSGIHKQNLHSANPTEELYQFIMTNANQPSIDK